MNAWALDDIHLTYPPRWGQPREEILHGVSLRIALGERVGLIGESGSGKTTLAHVGLGLRHATSGTVHLLGEDTTRWSAKRWRHARHDAQLLLQNPRAMLHPARSLEDLLRESVRLHRPGTDPVATARHLLRAVSLDHRRTARPHELSGGELRRAGIARILATRPRLVVADEPTTGLDAALKPDVVTTLFEHLQPQCAVVLVSHDLPLVLWACHRIVVLHEGRVVDRFASDQAGRVPHAPETLALLEASGLPWNHPPHPEAR